MAQWWDKVARSVSSSSNELVNVARAVSNNELVDALPVASQGKSLFQALSGDRLGAQQTQDNFTRRCVGVSQLRSALEHHNGDVDAAAETRAEFSRTLQTADQQARAAISAAAPVVQNIGQEVEKAAQRFKESELASDLGRGARFSIQAAEQAAQHLSEGEIGKRLGARFSELLALQHRQSCGARSQGSAFEGPINSLNDFTILTEAQPCHVGVQCSCCLEPLEVGETLRVLPCFHALHQRCADKWLYAHPICPVCRCDIRSSLEEHER